MFREKGDSYYKEQYESIPSFFDNSIHETHVEPCYKKYTLPLSKDSNSPTLHQLLKNLFLINFYCPPPPPRSPENLRLPLHSKENSLSKKVNKKVNEKITKPKLITTHMAENIIKAVQVRIQVKIIVKQT